MIKVRVRLCTCSLWLSSLPLLVILSVNVHTKNTRNELARLALGTILLLCM